MLGFTIVQPNLRGLDAVPWSIKDAVDYSALLTGIYPETADFKSNHVKAMRDLLSLFAVTRSDSSAAIGSWDKLAIYGDKNLTEEEQIRKALFGDGTQAGGLISQVLIGKTANQYINMKTVLNKLTGIKVASDDVHHFHIYLRPPQLLSIGGNSQNLLADDAEQGLIDASTLPSVLETEAQNLMRYIENNNQAINMQPGNISIDETGDETVITVDMPVMATLNTPMVMSQVADNRNVNQNFDYILKTCQEVPSGLSAGSAQSVVYPRSMLSIYLKHHYNREIDIRLISNKLIETPKHGEIKDVYDPSMKRSFLEYVPFVVGDRNGNEGYEGKDRAVYLLEFENKRYKLIINFIVTPSGAIDGEPSLCPADTLIKLNYLPSQTAPFAEEFAPASSITYSFTNLPGTSVGQTTGEGSNASILLDTNAAGHGWFMDSTPFSNEEYLPTSNPNEWIAKAGTDAAGKMDLLSVLLHEYGHALGFEHSADTHDFMGTSLQPGVRRLPSPDDLALMAKLIGEIRLAEAAETLTADSTLSPNPSPTSGGGEPGQTPNAPLPDPFTLASLLSLGFIRRGTDAGSTTASSSPAESLIAANPTLVNGNFAEAATGQVADGWSSYGAVALQSGAAILSESAKAQTNLSQTFVVGEHDRFLRFTVSDLGLNQVADGPQDAFEVALLNAGTFAPITATINLSHADALLNIQEDGTERRIDTLQRIVNADGSSTYMLDLRGIAAGTAVTLSFDLLGFGAQDSHVAIRDVRLVNLPETRDDEAATAEDTAITIAALANDTDADLERGFLPEVVSAAQHGVVTVNADGTFSYVPHHDFYGTDSFSYQLSDGQNHSNTATVAMTVAPVNDAPVSQASEVTTAEDTPLVIDLSPLASDVDSATLTPSIVTGPLHGTLSQNADGTYTYTPDSNYNGPDAFSYKVNDDELDSKARQAVLTTINQLE